MQVVSAHNGFAWCEGRGEQRQIRTTLIGPTQPGQWLLTFLDDARELLDAQRAAEINGALDLLLGAIQGTHDHSETHIAFALPSEMNLEQVFAMTRATEKELNDEH